MNKHQKVLLSALVTSFIGAEAAYANEANPILIDPVVITAKTNTGVDSIASTVNIITAEEIKESGATNLQDVLEQVSGFNFTVNSSSIGGRKNIGLRGMDSEHILILQDGERTNATDGFIGHSNFQSSYFDINNIERIEIIKGAGSVLYGSEAIGGVINIITKGGAKKSYAKLTLSNSTVDTRAGGDTKGYSIGAGGGYKGLYGSFSINRDNQDKIDNAAGTGVDFEEVVNKTINAAVSYNFTKKTKIDLSLLDSTEERNNFDPYYDIERTKYSVGFSTQIQGWDVFLKGYESKFDGGWHGFGQSPYYVHRIKNEVYNLETQGTLAGNHFLTIGAEQNKTSYTKDYSSPTKTDYTAESTTQKSLYLQDNISLGQDTLTAGLRYDDNSQFGSGISSSLGYVHKLDDGMSIKASFGTAFKTPNIKEADDNYVFSHGYPGATVFLGNSSLEPETSKNMEIAFVKKSDSYKFTAALYHTKIEDMITSKDTGTPSPITGGRELLYVNISEAKVTGLEVEYDVDLTDSLFLDTSFTIMETDDDEGNDLPFRPDFMAKVKLSKEITENVIASVSANHTGDSFDGTDGVDSYTLYDAAINANVHKNVSLQFAVKNISDEKLDNTSGNHISELLGREFKVSVSLDF